MWKNESTTFESAPAGTFLARCIKIIDIGTQTGEYKGERTVARKNIIFWELPNELRDDGKPFITSKFYTASLGEKANLRKDLVNWRGREFTSEELKGFDEKNILDKCCLVTITEKESGKTAVSGISGVPKGMPIPERINDLLHFSLIDFDQKVYDKLSDGIKKLIKESAEFDSLGITDDEDSNYSQAMNNETEKPNAAANSFGANEHYKGSAPNDEDIPFALIFAFLGLSFYLSMFGQIWA